MLAPVKAKRAAPVASRALTGAARGAGRKLATAGGVRPEVLQHAGCGVGPCLSGCVGCLVSELPHAKDRELVEGVWYKLRLHCEARDKHTRAFGYKHCSRFMLKKLPGIF
jgi:hypothetical protein